MYEMTEEEFEQAIADALDTIPERFLDELENVAIIAEDEPQDWQLGSSGASQAHDGDLLGLYDGVSLPERGNGYGGAGGDYPDTIWVFKGPHERLAGGRDEVLDEVRKTVVHEVGHYFGMTEEQIARMGYA